MTLDNIYKDSKDNTFINLRFPNESVKAAYFDLIVDTLTEKKNKHFFSLKADEFGEGVSSANVNKFM